MATEKQLNVRLSLKYDSLANWMAEANQFVLRAGEMACVAVDTTPTGENSPKVTTAPTVLFKVGDGQRTFNELQWASAKAADVHAWAKLENPTLDQLPENLRNALNGKVASVTAGDTTVTVGGTATDPTVAANISTVIGNRLTNNGGLYVVPAAVGLVASDEKVIKTVANADGGLNITTVLGLNYDSTNKKLQLLGMNNAEVDSIDVSAFVKDGMIKEASYADGKITLTFNTDDADGVQSDPIEIDVSDLIDVYTAGNGLKLENNKFSIKLATDNEKYLTVDENGLKTSGIATIDGLAQNAHTRLDRISLTQDKDDGHKFYFNGPDTEDNVTIIIPDNDTTYSAGTGLVLNGTTFNHSNSVAAQSTAAFKKVSYDSQGHITGSADVTAADIPTLTLAKISDVGAAAAKDVDTAVRANSENLITSGAVQTSINTLGQTVLTMANTAENNAKAFATGEADRAEQNAKDYADEIVQSFGGTVGDGTVTLSGDDSITATGSFTLNQAENASLTVSLKDSGVTEAKIANNAVTTDKVADNAITSAKIADGAVTAAKIPDLSIVGTKLAVGTIATAQIADAAVTKAKLDTPVQTSLAAADAALQAITSGTGLAVSAKSGNIQTISFDDSVVFVFNCGDATHLVD